MSTEAFVGIARSVNGVTIRLTAKRWQHIVESHNDMAGHYFDILTTVGEPERVLGGDGGELIAVREHSPGKYFVVMYREVSKEDGFVITAFLTRRVRQLERRRVLWRRTSP